MRVLGKGLSQLIGEQADTTVSQVAVDAIVPNQRQPRTYFNEVAVNELADSIREVGILQPLVVRPLSEGRYELIAGERRLRASKLAGLEMVPVVVRSADDRGSLELALIENLQREDISPLESAKAYRKLMDEFSLTQEQVSARVGKSRVAIANTVRLLKLPERILEALEKGELTEGHARALLGLPNQAIMLAVFEQIQLRGLTVKDVEKLASETSDGKPKTRRVRTVVDNSDPNWRALKENLAMSLGAPVKLEGTERGGRIIIDFFSEEDLLRIADALGAAI
jgi:ParB family chromosome partitioning protein